MLIGSHLSALKPHPQLHRSTSCTQLEPFCTALQIHVHLALCQSTMGPWGRRGCPWGARDSVTVLWCIVLSCSDGVPCVVPMAILPLLDHLPAWSFYNELSTQMWWVWFVQEVMEQVVLLRYIQQMLPFSLSPTVTWVPHHLTSLRMPLAIVNIMLAAFNLHLYSKFTVKECYSHASILIGDHSEARVLCEQELWC